MDRTHLFPNAAPERSEDAVFPPTSPHAAPKRSEAADSPPNPAPTHHKPPALPLNPRHRGVVMVIALLAIMLIASLVFYVFNVGTSVRGRIVTQHAADAAAVGGASQVARSLNTVAMNNVETTKLIIGVNLLDSLPMAIDMSITDETEEELGDTDAVALAIAAQLRAGVIDTWFEAELRRRMNPASPDSVVTAQRHMRELDDLFRTQPDLVPEMTWYSAPSGEMGKMHQAMRSMDAQSRAVMQTFGETAQAAATRSAEINLSNDEPGAAGLLLPAVPNIPWQRGVFDDFERPVRKGLLPGADRDLVVDSVSRGLGQVDDEVIRRGPWDALFGWRTIYPNQRSNNNDLRGFPSPPVSQTPSPTQDPEEYQVDGPQEALLSIVPKDSYITRRGWSPLSQKIWDIYSIKSNYLWPGTTIRTVLESNWEVDIDRDNERTTDLNDTYAYGVEETDIRQTAFVVVEMKSRLANDPGHPGRQGLTWNYITGRTTPFVIHRGGWQDPRDGPVFRINPRLVTSPPTWRRVQDYIWRISTTYETDPDSNTQGGDPDIGLLPIRTGTDADGNPTFAAQEVHWEIDVMLVGVNVGNDVEVNNPWEGFNRLSDNAPAPIDMVHDALPPNNAGLQREFLTFLGVAREPSRPNFWPTRFNGDRAYPYNSAIAQARVFNNHSWDLWTQTWQARLEPVNDFEDWADRADAAVTAAANIDGQDPEEVQQMADYLRSIEALSDVMLNH